MMKKLKIGYFADGPWSHEAFKLLIADPSIEIAFIVPRVDTKDKTLQEFASSYNIDYLPLERINSAAFMEKAKGYDCDLFVSMSFNQIFKSEITNLPKYKTINCHAGKLPFYRGRNILNWVLINDEKEFGITVHYIDEGIDTGDIILQRSFPITDEDDYNTLLTISYVECAKILVDAIKLIQAGSSERIIQKGIHPVGFYCGMRQAGDEIINWHQHSRDVFNFIRSVCKPGPQATTFMNNQEIKINKARLIEGAPSYRSTVGQIVGKTEQGYIVKTIDTTIEIFEIESFVKLKIGDRLG
jgi:methionyl-tRNA formyltransferase